MVIDSIKGMEKTEFFYFFAEQAQGLFDPAAVAQSEVMIHAIAVGLINVAYEAHPDHAPLDAFQTFWKTFSQSVDRAYEGADRYRQAATLIDHLKSSDLNIMEI